MPRITSIVLEICTNFAITCERKEAHALYDYRIDTTSNVILVKWKDNRVVSLLSNAVGVSPLSKARRYSFDQKTHIEIPQPAVVSSYNKNMGGVDRADQNISCYRISIRGKKWYFPLITWMIDASLCNAYQLARQSGFSQDLLAFRREVATCWLKAYGAQTRHCSRPSTTRNIPFDNSGHVVTVDQKRNRCVV